MDYYVNRMLTNLSTSIYTDLTPVEIPSDVAATFVGSTGYIDQIEPSDFISRKADVLFGKDQHGRQFISLCVLDTRLSASTLFEIVRGGERSENAAEELRRASTPRVLTLFQRYQDRDDLFVTAGHASLGSPKECPEEFYQILIACGGLYRRLTLEDLGTAEIAVPTRRVRAVEGYHIDGTVGVINL